MDIITLAGTVFWMTVSVSWYLGCSGTLLNNTQATLNHPTEGRATLLLIPYCLWLTFATYLNTSFWYQNRGLPELKED